LRLAALFGLSAVICQIALGGWVSSNYAALACQDFPTCQGAWRPDMDMAHAFQLHRELGQAADGSLLSATALTAIHWTHRVGALVVTVVIGALLVALLKLPVWRIWGLLLGLALAAQLTLGIANVMLSLPMPLAVAHNTGAALLLAVVLALNFRLWQRRH
jgi:cytochrome c oxidase assembly protein subunit 15